MYREDDTALIAVVEAVFVTSCETYFYQKVFVVAVFYGVFGESVTAVGAITQLEAVDDGITEAAFTEVGETYRLTLVGVHHGFGEILLREAVDVEHTFAFILRRQFFRCLLAFLYLDAIFFGEIAEGFGV